MDNDWHKILLVSVCAGGVAALALTAISFMFYIPELFK